MRILRHLTGSAMAIVACASAAVAQSGNPDISIIGDVRSYVTTNDLDPKQGNFQLNLESVEFALQGYLNPFARADVFAAYTDAEGLKIEEAYATILRGLPAGLQIKAGRYRVDFGKLNQSHPHAYSFLETPVIHREYLGEEGLMDVGIDFNLQIPVGSVVVTPSVNLLKGDFVARFVQATPPGPHGDLRTPAAASQRLGVFVPTGDWAGVEVGINALQGTIDSYTGRKLRLIGADFKYRWAPNKQRSLTLQGEWIRSQRDLLGEESNLRVTSQGFFAFADYRFAQRWNTGAIVERAEAADDSTRLIRRGGVFGGFQLMEETTMLRLLLRRTEDFALARPFNEAILQLVFSLGPHKAHWF